MPNSHNPTADCVFCKIIAGELPSQKIAETDRVVAFRDINPQAPLHALIVPKEHYGNVVHVASADPELLSEMVRLADEVASEHADGQFRFIFNSGPNAGQTVFHVHGHVLGGAKLGWSPA